MPNDIKKKIKKVLEHDKSFNLRRTKGEKLDLPIQISLGSLSFVDERFEEFRNLFNKPSSILNDVHPYCSLTVSENKTKLFSVTLCGNVHLFQLKLVETVGSLCFYNIKNYIFMDLSDVKKIQEIRKMFSTVKLEFIDWNKELFDVIGIKKTEILFFNGIKFYTMLTDQIVFIESMIEGFMRITDLKNNKNKCGICKTREYSFIIDDNPIIPTKYNKVCRKCFDIIKQTSTH